MLPIQILLGIDVGLYFGVLMETFAQFYFKLIFGDENYSKFNNFGSIDPKITKQQTCTLHRC
jgi:hypothetical protein